MVIAYCASGIRLPTAVDVALVYSLDRGVTFSDPIIVTNAADSEAYSEVAIALSTDGVLVGTLITRFIPSIERFYCFVQFDWLTAFLLFKGMLAGKGLELWGISIPTYQFPTSGPLDTTPELIDPGPAEHGRLVAGPNDRFLGTWQHGSGSSGALQLLCTNDISLFSFLIFYGSDWIA